MKLVRISLAAALATCALSTASFAQPLEEAIKGVDVSGMLRYRYTDDRYSNDGFAKDANRTKARHQWRINADLKTPVMNDVAMNVGVVYHNWNQTTNKGGAGASSVDTGVGLGAGSDGKFGVSTFFATFTPENTKTVVNVGKMRLNTPVTDALDDRGTGIVALNSDLPHWTFAGVALDTWALDDHNAPGTTSFTESLFGLAAIANYGDLNAQVWYFTVNDAVKNLIFSELAYKYDFLSLKGQLAYSEIDNGAGKLAAGKENNKNLLYTLEAGVNFAPVSATLGYIGSGADSYKVSFDNQGTFSMAGRNWNDGSATGVDYSTLTTDGNEHKLSVFYGTLAYAVNDKLGLALDFVKGEDEITAAKASHKVKFTEVVPAVSYKYSKNLTLATFYSMLKTEDESKKGVAYEDAKQNRYRFQAIYKF